MNSELKENKIKETNAQGIKEFLNSERCTNAGVVLISENNNKVKLGAMNPIYEKVLNIVEELNKFCINGNNRKIILLSNKRITY